MSPASPEVLSERVDQLTARVEKHDEQLRAIEDGAAGVREELAGIRGELRGALSASRMGGTIVGALVTFVGSAAIGLLLFMLGKR